MNKVGKIGEDVAVSYLKRCGYKIIARNFRLRCGEIDIIAKDHDYICFIEVKTRISDMFMEPFEGIDFIKQKKIQQTAAMWLSLQRLDNSLCRFDVIPIILNENHKALEIEHIKDAFGG